MPIEYTVTFTLVVEEDNVLLEDIEDELRKVLDALPVDARGIDWYDMSFEEQE